MTPGDRTKALTPVLRVNLSGRGETPLAESERYQAAIDLAEYADRNGFAVINVEEHHNSEVGWLGSPLLMAGLLAGRTKNVIIRGSAILAPLYDPIRLAEDVAVLDAASKGRFVLVIGQGYREDEYRLMDRDFKGRAAAMDTVIDTMLKAWTGKPFEYRGKTVHVSPLPFSQPHPPLFYGGMSAAAARRAAKWGLPFAPAQPMPEIEAIYRVEAARHGKPVQVENFADMSLLLIEPDPERAWQELGPYLMKEVRQYSAWTKSGIKRIYESGTSSIDELRASGIYEILTPAECLDRARRRLAEGSFSPILHPLAGGIPPERAWRSMRLFVEAVLKKI